VGAGQIRPQSGAADGEVAAEGSDEAGVKVATGVGGAAEGDVTGRGVALQPTTNMATATNTTRTMTRIAERGGSRKGQIAPTGPAS
jgi:hypothetical protein